MCVLGLFPILGCDDPPSLTTDADGSVQLVDAFTARRFDRPVWLTHVPHDSTRVFVVEQDGRVWVVPTDGEGGKATVFLDLADRVRREHNEEGLLALAFHPRFASNGWFFVYYSASDPVRNVLARYRVDAADSNRADAASAIVLLDIGKPFGNHNGCTLVFGPDGYLYLSVGDGGSGGDPMGNGQNLATLLGKILRLDVDATSGRYAIPPDNPFVNRAGARGEIWAYGLRNVWRMSFDRATGALWAGDVGQNRWEEIDRIVAGGNYGWSLREGRHAYGAGGAGTGLLDPLWEYSHAEGASVTGGYVYRGSRWPDLVGWYIYGDFVSGTIWGLRGEGSQIENRVLLRQPKNIASFGEDAGGELYVLTFDGRIHRLESRVAAGDASNRRQGERREALRP